ncbi:hypothetical protein MRB53_040206 [Persea americana]|nr:hypothetical protein MRB53_040206 [Persea americana]
MEWTDRRDQRLKWLRGSVDMQMRPMSSCTERPHYSQENRRTQGTTPIDFADALIANIRLADLSIHAWNQYSTKLVTASFPNVSALTSETLYTADTSIDDRFTINSVPSFHSTKAELRPHEAYHQELCQHKLRSQLVTAAITLAVSVWEEPLFPADNTDQQEGCSGIASGSFHYREDQLSRISMIRTATLP